MPKKKKRAPFMNSNQAKQLEKLGILERVSPTPTPRPKKRKKAKRRKSSK